MSRPYKKPALALDTNLVQDNTPQEIVPGIFIGSIHAAFNQEALINHKISHILNASRIPATFPKHFTYLSIDIRDKDESNLLACIPASNIFIEAGIDAGGVLVHCFGGRSRSAALVAAFLMSSRNWTLDQALETIVSARPVASVNKGFDRQLIAYFCTKYDIYAAQQVLLRNRVASLRHIRKALLLRDTASTEPKTKTSQGDTAQQQQPPPPQQQTSPSQSGVLKRDRTAGNLDDNMDLGDEEDASEEGGHNSQSGESKDERRGPSSKAFLAGIKGAAVAVPTLARTKSGNVLDESIFPIPVSEGTAPNCRLSRPGSNSVRVIPPLRGLERRYDCLGCGFSLFALSNVLREDLDLNEAIEATHSLPRNPLAPGGGGDDAMNQEEEGMDPPLSSRNNGGAAAKRAGGGEGDIFSSTKSTDSITNFIRVEGPGGVEAADAKESAERAEDKGDMDVVDLSSPQAVLGAGPSTGRYAQAKGFFDDPIADSNSNSNSSDIHGSSSSSGGGGGGGSGGLQSLQLPIEQAERRALASGGYSNSNISSTINSHNGSGGRGNGSSRERPQSAEKRRWLARVSLLKADAKESISRPPLVPDDKAAKLAADDDSVVEQMQMGRSKHLFLEYLEWMGRAPLEGESQGLLQCPNCQKVLGSWSWGRTPHQSTGEGAGTGIGTEAAYFYHDISTSTCLEPPLFAVLREAVQLAYMPLDQTPNATPRKDNSNNSTPRDSINSRDGSTETSPRPFGSPRPGSGAGRPGSGSLSAASRARAGVDQLLLGRPGSGSRPSTGSGSGTGTSPNGGRRESK